MDLLNLVAKLTLDKSDYENGLRDSENDANSIGSRIGSAIGTVGKVSAVGLGVAATAVGKLTWDATNAFKNYEQLVGGVETLFGTGGKDLEQYAASVGKTMEEAEADFNNHMYAQQTVLENADKAFDTAGMSANEYMETVTGFAASLIQSLNGDELEAAKKADMAISDMSDNANKMGTAMESIQYAYSGFAKQNYTMLDNLKLGYGGTKEEMERLLTDAQAMKAAQGEYVEYSIDSYADIVDAIHVVQTEMGITGTTAEEGAKTVEGSGNRMKAAWSNVVTNLRKGNGDLSKSIKQFLESAKAYISNLAPVVSDVLVGIGQFVSEAVPELLQMILPMISEFVPKLMRAAISLVKTVISALPDVLKGIVPVLTSLIENIGDIFPEEIKKYVLPAFGSITAFLDDIFKGDWTAAWAEINNIFHNAFTGVTQFFYDKFNAAKDVVASIDWVSIGKNIIKTIQEALTGLSSMMLGLFANAMYAVMSINWGEVGSKIFTLVTFALGQLVEYAKNVFTMAKEVIEQIDWVEAGHKIVEFFVKSFEAIVDGVKEIDWIGLGTSILDYIKTAFSAAVDFFGTIFTDVWNYICQIDWVSLGSWMLELIKSGLSAAVEVLKNIFFGSSEDDTDGVFGAIKSINWFDLGSKILDLIKDGLSAAVTVLKNIFLGTDEDDTDGVFGAIKSINWVGLGESILTFIKNGLSTAVDVLKTIFFGKDEDDTDGVFGAIKGINWVGLGESILGFIKDGLSAAVTVLKTIFFGKDDDDTDGVYGAIKSINWVGLGEAILGLIKDGLSAAVSVLKTIFFGTDEDDTDGVYGAIKGIKWKELGTKILDFIKEGLSTAVSVLKFIFFGSSEDDTDGVFGAIKHIKWKDLGSKMLGFIKDGFGTAVSIFKTIFQGEDGNGGVLGAIKDINWLGLGSDIMNKIKTGVGFLGKGIAVVGESVVSWATSLGESIRDRLFGDNDGVSWSDLGGKLWNKIKAGFGFIGGAAWEGIGKVAQWAYDLGQQIVAKIFETNWWQVGKDMFDGIKSAFVGDLFDISKIRLPKPIVEYTPSYWGPFEIPDWSIRWEAKGYNNPLLFNSPGLLGGYGFGDLGSYQGGEMVYSHDKLMKDIREASSGGNNITIYVTQKENEDSEALAERISEIMNDDYNNRSRDQVVYA